MKKHAVSSNHSARLKNLSDAKESLYQAERLLIGVVSSNINDPKALGEQQIESLRMRYTVALNAVEKAIKRAAWLED